MAKSTRAGRARLSAKFGGVKRVFGTTVFFGLDRLVIMGGTIFVLAILARKRTAEDFGRFNFALSNLQIAVAFLAAGAEAVFIRELVRRVGESLAILWSAVSIVAVGSAATIALWVSIGWAFQDAYTFKLSAAFAAGLIFNPLLAFEALFKARAWAGRLLAIRCGVLFLGAIFKAYLVWTGATLTVIALAISAESAILAIVVAAVGLRMAGELPRSVPTLSLLPRSDFVFLARQSVPAMVSSVIVIFHLRFAQIGLSTESSFVEVSRYSTAFVLIQVVNFVAAIFYTVAYPRLINLHAGDPDKYERVNSFLLSVCGLIGYFVIIVCWLFGGDFLTIAFGPKYRNSASVLQILSVVVMITLSGSLRSQMTYIADLPEYHIYNAVGGFLILIPACFLLIPRFGAEGAAAALVAGAMMSGVIMPLLLRKTHRMGILQLRGFALLDLRQWRTLLD
jgi:O-antigen/teichoic acid export membrane protein